MHITATALSPFVRHTLRVMLWSTVGLSAFWTVALAPLWMCGATCHQQAEVQQRVARFMANHGPDASFSAKETLELQLGALGSNAALGNDFGIRYAYELASDDNRAATGPYPHFAQMVKAHYAPLLDYDTVEIEPLGGCSSEATFLVHVVNHDGVMTSYAWTLSRRDRDGAFATDAVFEIEPDAMPRH